MEGGCIEERLSVFEHRQHLTEPKAWVPLPLAFCMPIVPFATYVPCLFLSHGMFNAYYASVVP